MTLRVGIAYNDPLRDGVVLAIGNTFDGGVRICKELGQQGPVFVIEQPGVTTDHTIFLPDEIAFPLLDALAKHYSGTTDMRTLREDYLAERRRVDKFIDYHLRSSS